MESRQYFSQDFFVYELDFLALASGASATNSFTIQQEADFLLTKITMFADIGADSQSASTRVIPLTTIMIQDTGSGRNLMNAAVPIPNIFGEGGLPFILPRQRRFIASSVVSVTLTNFDAVETYNIRLSFIGEKAFMGRGGAA